jgi:hypothetical protein
MEAFVVSAEKIVGPSLDQETMTSPVDSPHQHSLRLKNTAVKVDEEDQEEKEEESQENEEIDVEDWEDNPFGDWEYTRDNFGEDMEIPEKYMTGTEIEYMEATVQCEPANMVKCYYDMADVALEKATRFFYIAEASAAYSGVQRMEYLKRVQEQPMDEAEEELWFKDYVQKKQLFEDETLKQVWAMTVKAKRKAEEGIQGDKPNFRFYALRDLMANLIRSQILQKVRETGLMIRRCRPEKRVSRRKILLQSTITGMP